MESVTLWIALSPQQFADLNSGKEVQPDEYSQRFGLRTSAVEEWIELSTSWIGHLMG